MWGAEPADPAIILSLIHIYLFNETSVYHELINAEEFPFFANSFFVEAKV